jgi:hydrogenase maturation protease
MTLVIGIGSPYGGDDSVGLVVAERMRGAGFDAVEAHDVSAIVTLLGATGRVIIVDALVGAGEPGRVVHLSGCALEGASEAPSGRVRRNGGRASSHGFGIAQAVALARVLDGDACARDIHLVGIVIEPPRAAGTTLSAPVAAAVDRAVAIAQGLARD